ncbi:Spy/CpxP family protein refolding chaperone [Rhodopseudomonas sp. P2A-2r]|uniref:Spy/CpxP family protein refolding chaperone n=1 Tax=Rhodopseudomonas sp. P2A-2r TaxID=2991972 RepID=UPI0022344935|nr:Spy/CpxP family protein refolding chaperone [Rhodopseudomonas sp. P2A-2r]UZE47589.1 Spy/CpxP family protein refolding chaperone [Rhodopseudomonas sp. P2A-2r]
MRKTMLLLASTALIAVSTLASPAQARDRDREDRSEVTANQLINQADAQTARMKADLRLTPAQEKDWAAFEDARHQAAKRRADRAMAMQAAEKAARDADRATRDAPRTTDSKAAGDNATVGKATDGTTAAPPSLLDRINADADAQIERANDWKKLAEAARPLYASLDDRQRRRFAEILLRGDRERHDERERDRNRDRDRDRDDR